MPLRRNKEELGKKNKKISIKILLYMRNCDIFFLDLIETMTC